jgi:hypothetical protein
MPKFVEFLSLSNPRKLFELSSDHFSGQGGLNKDATMELDDP